MPDNPRPWRWALALAIPVLTVVVLAVVYRYTAPGARKAARGNGPVEVLQVGALPVT